MHNNVAIIIIVIRTVPATKQTTSHHVLNKRMSTFPSILTPNWFRQPQSDSSHSWETGLPGWNVPRDFHHKGRGAVGLVQQFCSAPGVLGWGFQERSDIKACQPVLALTHQCKQAETTTPALCLNPFCGLRNSLCWNNQGINAHPTLAAALGQ